MIEEPGQSGALEVRAADETVGVRAETERVALVQLAARWAETFGGHPKGTLPTVTGHFRAAFDYLDAVTHGLTPPDLEAD